MAESKQAKRRITGTVVSDKTDKTVVVSVERRVRHRIYGKAYPVTKKFYAHDEQNSAKTGDTVTIEECRPMSARKRWTLVPGDKPAAKEETK